MYGAFYVATIGACPEKQITYEDDLVDRVQDCKLIALEHTECQTKVEAQLGSAFVKEQVRVLNTLYPDESWTEESGATEVAARLVTHYQLAPKQVITTTVGQVMWGRPEELAVAPIALQEPIYVLEVHPDLQVYAQVYSYRDHVTADGNRVEVRTGDVMPILDFENFLHTCLDNRVLPPMLLLRHDPHGTHFQALRFANELYEKYLVTEPEDLDPCMRDRLGGVHKIMGMPVVTAFTTRQLLSQYSEPSAVGSSLNNNPRVRRIRMNSSASQESKAERVERLRLADEMVYDRVLALGGDLESGSLSDRRKHRSYTDANAAAINKWLVEARKSGWKIGAPAA